MSPCYLENSNLRYIYTFLAGKIEKEEFFGDEQSLLSTRGEQQKIYSKIVLKNSHVVGRQRTDVVGIEWANNHGIRPYSHVHASNAQWVMYCLKSSGTQDSLHQTSS